MTLLLPPGYQPVPQQPPASYPQGANSLPRGSSKNTSLPRGAAFSKNTSLPRGASLPRNSASLARGVSPIPRHSTY